MPVINSAGCPMANFPDVSAQSRQRDHSITYTLSKGNKQHAKENGLAFLSCWYRDIMATLTILMLLHHSKSQLQICFPHLLGYCLQASRFRMKNTRRYQSEEKLQFHHFSFSVNESLHRPYNPESRISGDRKASATVQ